MLENQEMKQIIEYEKQLIEEKDAEKKEMFNNINTLKQERLEN